MRITASIAQFDNHQSLAQSVTHAGVELLGQRKIERSERDQTLEPPQMDPRSLNWIHMGHSGEYGNAAKLVGKMSKSVMQLISIHFEIGFSF